MGQCAYSFRLRPAHSGYGAGRGGVCALVQIDSSEDRFRAALHPHGCVRPGHAPESLWAVPLPRGVRFFLAARGNERRLRIEIDSVSRPPGLRNPFIHACGRGRSGSSAKAPPLRADAGCIRRHGVVPLTARRMGGSGGGQCNHRVWVERGHGEPFRPQGLGRSACCGRCRSYCLSGIRVPGRQQSIPERATQKEDAGRCGSFRERERLPRASLRRLHLGRLPHLESRPASGYR